MMKKETHIKATLLLSLVFRDVSKLFLIVLLFSFNSFSQNKILIDSLPDKKVVITKNEFSQWTKNGNGVVFFCTNDYPREAYVKQSTLFDFNKIDSLKPFSINYILFNEFDNNSKNPYIQQSGFKDSIINQIECFVICDKKADIYRAINIFSSNFFILNVNENINLYQISFKGICPKDLTYSISLYYDLIYEIFNPQYTLEEKFDQQQNTIIQLKNDIEILNKKLIEAEINNHQNLRAIQEKLENLESLKKKKN